jgi:hypothetical protein
VPAAPGWYHRHFGGSPARQALGTVLIVLAVAAIVVLGILGLTLLGAKKVTEKANASTSTPSASASASTDVASLCPPEYNEYSLKNSCQYLGWKGRAPYEIGNAPSPGNLVVCKNKPTFSKSAGQTWELPGMHNECSLCWPKAVPFGDVEAKVIDAQILGQESEHFVQPAWYTNCHNGLNKECGMAFKDPSCVRKNADGSEDQSNCILIVPTPLP